MSAELPKCVHIATFESEVELGETGYAANIEVRVSAARGGDVVVFLVEGTVLLPIFDGDVDIVRHIECHAEAAPLLNGQPPGDCLRLTMATVEGVTRRLEDVWKQAQKDVLARKEKA